MIRTLILGASGYGGGELLRLLAGHPEVEAVRGVSRHHAGKPFHAAHPNLRGFLEGTFDGAADWSWLAEAAQPVCFAAMPHGELAKALPMLEAAWSEAGLVDRLTLIDLSGDFRLGSAEAFATHYGQAHPTPQALGGFVYGLADLFPHEVRGARRIANPGCFATALQLGLAPLAGLGMDHVSAFAITGSSGSGMNPSDTTHHPTRATDFRAYKALAHQHQGEVAQFCARLGITPDVAFIPHSAPLVRGIFATLQFQLPESIGAADVRARLEATYAQRPFVRLVEGSPKVAAVTGSNFADLGFVAEGREAAIFVAIDNLLKGMAGQAVQNMNLALGLSEKAGIWMAGGYPG
ncbi:MAG TPA: N-acetyl-gamma-glutamyl-phosphate reductase [Holophagaceae bacterium]|nr:N-acetyl-gamma-glutamyl-phosphate reductase [Holophagaceae bacterium]